jgi:hypothetical protein
VYFSRRMPNTENSDTETVSLSDLALALVAGGAPPTPAPGPSPAPAPGPQTSTLSPEMIKAFQTLMFHTPTNIPGAPAGSMNCDQTMGMHCSEQCGQQGKALIQQLLGPNYHP